MSVNEIATIILVSAFAICLVILMACVFIAIWKLIK